MADFTLIVEGDEDCNFLCQFIAKHFGVELDRKSDFIIVGGKSETLHMVSKQIQKSNADTSKRNILIFDADDNFDATLKAINENKDKLGLRFDAVFLFPNHKEPGNLETLLSDTIAKQNQELLKCIEDYASCASKLGIDGLRHIDQKSKLVIYHGSFESSGIAKGSERDYLSTGIWDLDSEILFDLKKFLTPFFKTSV